MRRFQERLACLGKTCVLLGDEWTVEEQKEAHKLDKKFLVVGAIAIILAVLAFAAYLYPGRGVGYAPAQPIPFSHKLHAGERKIQCQYCHSAVDRSAHSNIPSATVCLNCHRYVKTESPHIKKLWEAVEKNQPIQWIQVHVLPDFVYFNHECHIQRGISCEQCHGNVQQMDKVKQVAPLSMGWCVNCHREQSPAAPTDCWTCHR